MSNRSEIFSLRTMLPVGLGVALGLAIGAAALANVPVAKSQTVSPATHQTSLPAAKPLSSSPGISFALTSKDGERCFAARQTQKAETFCTH